MIKSIVSYAIAVIVMAMVCTGLLMFTGHYEILEALITGFSISIGSIVAPEIVDFLKKKFNSSK